MKLLHPFMPFVTTEIYDSIAKNDNTELMISSWPEVKEEFEYEQEEKIIEEIKEVITEIRNVRSTKNIHPSKKSEIIVVSKQNNSEIKETIPIFIKLGFASEVKIQDSKDNIPENSIHIIVDDIEIFMPLAGLIDEEEEKKRIEAEKNRLHSEIARCEKMLSNPGFISKAPQAKIDEEKAKLEKYKEMLKSIEENP